MIRKMIAADIDGIMRVWMAGNLEAHSFIPAEYWRANYEYVKNAIPQADVLVYVDGAGVIRGFIGVEDGYIAGLFVERDFRGKGIGRELLSRAKQNYSLLTLDVYLRNTHAIAFYEKNGFSVTGRKSDKNSDSIEYVMSWESEQREVKLLLTAFEGEKNSSRILLDSMKLPQYCEKLILKNSFSYCADQLYERLSRHSYDRIISFGEKGRIRRRIYIETCAEKDGEILKTDYDCKGFEKPLHRHGYRAFLSKHAGQYLCNHIYYHGMDYIRNSGADTKMVFVHIPSAKNLNSMSKLVGAFEDYIHETGG